MDEPSSAPPTSWWQVEGQIADGSWVAVYQAANRAEGLQHLRYAFRHWDDELARYDDFRLLPPTADLPRAPGRNADDEVRARIDGAIARIRAARPYRQKVGIE